MLSKHQQGRHTPDTVKRADVYPGGGHLRIDVRKGGKGSDGLIGDKNKNQDRYNERQNSRKKEIFFNQVLAKDEIDEAFMEGGDSIDSDAWRALAKKYDPFYRDMCNDNRWLDVLLMCPEGSIVYTLAKESDLGLFVDREPLKSSGIGEAFQKLQLYLSTTVRV